MDPETPEATAEYSVEINGPIDRMNGADRHCLDAADAEAAGDEVQARHLRDSALAIARETAFGLSRDKHPNMRGYIFTRAISLASSIGDWTLVDSLKIEAFAGALPETFREAIESVAKRG